MEANEPDGEGPQPAVQELPLMERLEHLADSWIAIARTLAERG